MKSMQNMTTCHGGKATLSYLSPEQVQLQITGYFDDFEFGAYDAQPQGQFYKNGYKNSIGKFFRSSESPITLVEEVRDLDLVYTIFIDMYKISSGTLFIITRSE